VFFLKHFLFALTLPVLVLGLFLIITSSLELKETLIIKNRTLNKLIKARIENKLIDLSIKVHEHLSLLNNDNKHFLKEM